MSKPYNNVYLKCFSAENVVLMKKKTSTIKCLDILESMSNYQVPDIKIKINLIIYKFPFYGKNNTTLSIQTTKQKIKNNNNMLNLESFSNFQFFFSHLFFAPEIMRGLSLWDSRNLWCKRIKKAIFQNVLFEEKQIKVRQNSKWFEWKRWFFFYQLLKILDASYTEESTVNIACSVCRQAILV